MTSGDIHALALHLRSLSMRQDLSVRQEWLWDSLMSELEYRQRNWKGRWRFCTCELCMGPPATAKETDDPTQL